MLDYVEVGLMMRMCGCEKKEKGRAAAEVVMKLRAALSAVRLSPLGFSVAGPHTIIWKLACKTKFFQSPLRSTKF